MANSIETFPFLDHKLQNSRNSLNSEIQLKKFKEQENSIKN